MLVYGDAKEEIEPRAALAAIAAALDHLDGAGIERHAATVEAFIALAGLAQGFADAEAAARGGDDLSAAQQRLHAVLLGLAGAIDASWRSGFAHQPLDPAAIRALADLSWPATVTVRRCEGYAFYGLYPETMLEAARGLPPGTAIIGIRSIGTGLAALAAAAAGGSGFVTVRPTGHPFARQVQAGPELSGWVRAHDGAFAIVDEGPGLSGSSFGGVADWLESLGVAAARLIFLPSHAGDPGAQASPTHRRRWETADRRVRPFEQLLASRLPDWFRDITGDLTGMQDMSAGRWAERTDLPTSPSREARKYLLTGRNGRFLARFAGLDTAARAKVERGRALHAAGLANEPLALRYGFTLEHFLDAAPARHVPPAHLAAYLRFRAERFSAARAGATLADLRIMAAHNIAQGTPAAAPLLDRWTDDRLHALQAAVRPVHIDGRLHRWEWLYADGRLLKTDALDHSTAHDLIGPQDILWDVAAATIELPETAAITGAFTAGDPARQDLLAFLTLAYLAFQLGWWSLSDTPAGEERSRCYRERLLAAGSVPHAPLG